MTLEQLKYLQAIVKHGSFRAAADSVYRSQSSLSISIQKLEQELGIQLFERSGYRPKLTQKGKAIYEKSKQLLKKSQELKDLAAHLTTGCEAELRLAISCILPIEPIASVLNHVSKDYPQTRISMLIESLSGTMERLLDDDADIALTDSFEPNSNLESLLLTEIDFISVVPSKSKWAKQANSITEQDLENETIIVMRDTSQHSKRITKGVLEGAPQWVVNDFTTKQRIICSGKGWGRMPLHLVKEDIAKNRLTMLTSDDFPTFRVPIHLVRKTHKHTGPVEQMLWSTLKHMNWKSPVTTA